ncbi:MAG: ABC transporter permease, partial [Bacteroidota bacterium]
MSLYKLILKSLWYFRRQHLAVLAGTIISTAVLTGALIVGDSVKYTLTQLVEKRLGATKFALQTGDRFVRAKLADEISNKLNISTASLLIVQGIAINSDGGQRINSTNVLGVKSSFWQLSDIKMPELKADEAIISANTAQNLNLKVGDELLLRVQNADVIPLNAPFVSQENNSIALRLKIIYIADDKSLGRFSLKSNQTAPYNIFVSHKYLSEKLELKGLSNLILVAEDENQKLNSTKLDETLNEIWQLEDVGVKIQELKEQGKYELVSSRIFIDEAISEAAANINIPYEQVLTYLVNSISFNDKETPYSFVTAATEPIIPNQLSENEIVINEWLANDLQVKKGDSINLKYYIIGPLRTLVEENKSFIINDIIPTQSTILNNSLMPSFPGLSDAGNCRDWETGIPIDLDKIRDKDEEYWNDYRGTPKAFISSEMGQHLWNNKFGNYTAIRFGKNNVEQSKLQNELLKRLNPADFKLVFTDVKTHGLNAVNNSVDFGGLFLSLSFFVIVAGILLTVLIYSLNTESRKQETGILSGLGYKKNQILKIRFYESIIIIVIGGILGSLMGIVYNYGIIAGLNSVWQDAVKTNLLQIFINPITLIIGAFSGILIALIAIYFITIKSLKNPIANLVKEKVPTLDTPGKINVSNKLLGIIGILGSAGLVLYSLITSVDENAALFLSASALFIFGSIALLNHYLKKLAEKISKKPYSLSFLAL